MSRDRFSGTPRIFLSYARKGGEEFATRLRNRLQTEQPEIVLWQDRTEMEGGVGWWKQIEEALDQVRFLVIVMTPAAMQSEMTRKEWRYARQRGVNVYPVKGCREEELDYASLPNWMRKAHFFDLDKEWETFVNYLKSDRPPTRVPFMAPDIPDGFVKRPREFEQLIAQVLDAKRENPIAITTALQGAGGYGKTTLALAVCHDDQVIGAFDDGILWVTLGQNPNILAELTKLYKALTGDQPTFLDEEDAVLELREKLENRNCLLVIDDVWQKAHLKPFLAGGKQTCARLITSRRLDIAVDARRVHVDEMTPEESGALVAARLPAEHRPPNIAPLRHLTVRLMEWPLLLKLAAGVIRGRLERDDTFEKALDYVTRVYNKRGLIAFDPKDAVERNDAAAKSIEASLELLDKDGRTRLRELAIFPEDTDVPLRMIELLWGLDDLDTQETVELLANYGLVDLDLREGLVRLHDEIRSYLQSAISDETAVLHARFLDRLGNPKQIQDDYALRWLAWHLDKAGRHAELRTLLLDFEWMMVKLEKADIQSLLADYGYSPNEPCLHLVRDAIRLSAHVLVRDRRQLASQLTGRLLGIDDNDIQALLKQAAQKAPRPSLWPLRGNLTPPGGPLIRILEGHSSDVSGVAITPDGRRAVSASYDNTLRVWDLATGETKTTLRGHTGRVNAVAVTSDGRYLVSGSDDNTLRVWDLATGETKNTLQGHARSVYAVAVTPDGRHVVSGSDDNTLRVWDLATGETKTTLQDHTDMVRAVAVTPDGRHAVSGSDDNTLRVWDLATGKIKATLQGHASRVNAVAVTPDGRHAVSGSDDNTLRVWDLATGETKTTLQGHARSVYAVAVTPDGRHVVSGSDDNTLRVWDLATGESVHTLEGHSSSVNGVAITPDGRRAVSASGDNTLRVWDLESGQSRRTLEGHSSSVNGVAITPDGRRAVSASGDNTLRVWDLESGQSLRTLEGHSSDVSGVAITPDGRRAVSASWDKTLRVWDLATGETKTTLRGHTGRVNAVAVTSDGRYLVSGSDDHTLRVWDLATGETKNTLQGHTREVSAVAVTPDGRRAVSASYDKTLRVWDLESGQSLRTLEGHSFGVNGVAITPDGRRAVSASYDETLRIWDLESDQSLRTLEGHSSDVNGVAITPDGRRAISASWDKTLRVWDLESGKELALLTADGTTASCAISLDGRTIVAGDATGNMHILKMEGFGPDQHIH